MLVLSRHKDERILIGDDIILTVIEIRGDKVRFGFDAPKHVRILREELVKGVADVSQTVESVSQNEGS